MKKSKGFTLIELLVVIAIIGILAAIVLVSLSGAKNKAYDVRITADMGQLRTTAQIANDTDGDYSNVCLGALPCVADIQILNTDMKAQKAGDVVITLSADKKSYCAYKAMNTGYWCIDSKLTSCKVTTAPGASNCTSATPACPTCGS